MVSPPHLSSMCLISLHYVVLTVAHKSHLYYLSVAMPSQVPGSFQSTSPLLEPGCTIRPDSSSILARPAPGGAVPSWPVNSVQPLNSSQGIKG